MTRAPRLEATTTDRSGSGAAVRYGTRSPVVLAGLVRRPALGVPPMRAIGSASGWNRGVCPQADAARIP